MKFIFIVITPFLFISHQTVETKSPTKMLDSLFCNIPFKADKFDVRKAMQLNPIFLSIGEGSASIENDGSIKNKGSDLGASLSKLPILKYKGTEKHTRKGNTGYYKVENTINYRVYFNDSTHKSTKRTIWFDYEANEINKCDSQLQEFKSIFQPLSHSTSEIIKYNLKKEKNGIGYSFFSSKANSDLNKPFLTIFYAYSIVILPGENGQYQFQIDLFEEYF